MNGLDEGQLNGTSMKEIKTMVAKVIQPFLQAILGSQENFRRE